MNRVFGIPAKKKLGFTKIDCRQGEVVSGCQKEFAQPQQRSVGTTPTLIATNNPYRDAILITNLDQANTLFVGPYFVTVLTGQGIPPQQSISFPITAEIWGIASIPLTCSYVEAFI